MSGRSTRASRAIALAVGAAVAVAPAGVVALAQQRPAAEATGTPDLAEGVLRLLEAPYLSDEERADLRVFHGVWRESDLESPARRARAALMVGALDDPSLNDPGAAVEDRAEARVLRGDLAEALEALAGATSVRAVRIRAEALEGLGRFDEADAAIEPVVADLLRNRFDRAPDLVEAVNCLTIRARLRGQPASDYRAMMTLLGRAHDQLDRLYWPAMVSEAELLYDKDNRPEAAEAIDGLLKLNPACARAWALRGQLAVDGFAFKPAEQVAETLDRLAARIEGGRRSSSPYADVILAEAWLRQNDPDMAEEQLAPTLARYPKMREALALRCAIQAVRYDFPGTEKLLDAFDKLSPGSPLALYTVGKALSEARQYPEAADFLERAVARQKNWPQPLIELGLLEMQSGRDQRAADALRRVAELDPFNTRVANSLKLLEELLTYESVESEHFIVRYKPGEDAVLAREMLPLLEKIYVTDTTNIEFEPPVKTTIELMPDHEWFAVRIVGMPDIHTIAAATGPVIAMEAPRIGVKHLGPYDWVRVIRHEFAHTVTLARTRNRIPHWFTEAAAVNLEGGPRDYSTCQLLVDALTEDGLFDMRQINVAFVRPEKPTDRAQAYAQGHWMYQYILERFGKQAPLDLMDMYAKGIREDQAMRSVLGVSQEEFVESFKEWARAQAETWGMLPSPTMRELLLKATLADSEAGPKAKDGFDAWTRSVGFATLGGGRAAPLDIDMVPPTPERVDAWLAEMPDHPDLLELKVESELAGHGGDPTDDMAPLLERYAAARPVDPMPHRHLARLYLASDDPTVRAKAIPHLVYLDAREQKSAAYAVELAKLYAAQDDWNDATARAERATEIAPYDASNREVAASVALRRGDLATAERHIRALIVLEPDRPIHQKRLEALEKLRAAKGDAGTG